MTNKRDIEEIRKRLESFDINYENDPNLSKRLEEARRKYSSITFEDLYRPFTI